MNLPELSIRRPVTVFMLMMIVLLFGFVSMTKLPVELYPNTSFGEISIVINIRGGIPPTEVESQVTRLVEEAVASVSYLQQLLSISKEGESTVVMSFQPGTDMDFAALDVREKFSKVKNLLPKEIEKPVIAQFQQNDVPILIVSAISEVRSTEDIRKIVDETMKENLKRVSGVANVEVAGGRARKILVEGDRTRLAAFGIPMDEITSVVAANNLNLLSGEIDRERDRFLVRMIGEFKDVEMIKQLPLRITAQGSIIRVRDVAGVKDGYMEPSEYARLNTRPVVTIYVQKESSKNTITVAKGLLDEMDRLKAKLPKDIRLVVTSNQADFIQKAIDNLSESLLKGVVLIILVFFLFLYQFKLRELLFIVGLVLFALFFKGVMIDVILGGLLCVLIFVKKFRPIIIVTTPIPISVVGSFIFMRSVGLTINVMTLFGLALGVGMLIDNSIVVFENILKKVEQGHEPGVAADEGSSEMLLTLVASNATNIIVFLPLLFMGDELQRLYSGMAGTIVISLLISILSALTIVPMMSARKRFSMESVGASEVSGKTGFKRFSTIERKFLFQSIRYRSRLLLISLIVFGVSMFFVSKLGTEYLGGTEQNKFTVHVELPTGARLDISDKMVKKVEKILKKVPEVINASTRVEGWSSKIYVEVVKSTQRKRSLNEIIESIRPQTDRLYPAFIYFQQEEMIGTKEIVIEIYGYNYDKLRELAIGVSNRLGQIKGLTDVKIRMREGRPEMDVLIDKKAAGYYGLTAKDNADQIHGQMRGLRAGDFHTEGKEVEIVTRLQEKYRKTFKDLHYLLVGNKDGDTLMLDQVANYRFGLGPSEIWRKDKNRVVQVTANLGKIPLSKVAEQVKQSLKSVPFPEDYYYRIAGDYPVMIRMTKQMTAMILFVLVLIYLVLASLFESFAEPVLIMVAVPLAIVGVVAALYLGPKAIGAGSMIGMMMLGGIVVNHSIMLVDRINFFNKRNISPIKSAIMANKHRLRPILMTMSMTVLGMLPMAIDQSEGANLWSPLAITVIGGVISSTIFTLMVTPAFYVMYRDVTSFLRKIIVKSSKLPAD